MLWQHFRLVFPADQEHILNTSSLTKAKNIVAVRLEAADKNVCVLFVLSECKLALLITCAFPAQYNGVLLSLLNSADG